MAVQADRIACLPGAHQATMRTIREALELGVKLIDVSLRTIKESAPTEAEARRILLAMGVPESKLDFSRARAYGRAEKLRETDPVVEERWDPGCPNCKGGRLYIEASGQVSACFAWPYPAGNVKPGNHVLDRKGIMAILRSEEFAKRLEEIRHVSRTELLAAGRTVNPAPAHRPAKVLET